MDQLTSLLASAKQAATSLGQKVATQAKTITGTQSSPLVNDQQASSALGAPSLPNQTITGGRRHRKRRYTKRYMGGRKTRRRGGSSSCAQY